MSTRSALSRTLLLMRTELEEEVPDGPLLDALLGTEVALVADKENLDTREGQDALVATASLVARSGARCYLDVPEAVRLQAPAPPLKGDRLVDALVDLGRDLIPGQFIHTGLPAHQVDLAIVIGDTPRRPPALQTCALSGDRWTGVLALEGERWRADDSPFGALASAGLAAGEAFKVSMRKLRGHSASSFFGELFQPCVEAKVALAPAGTATPTAKLGTLDCVSGGAIVQAALFALLRLPGVRGQVRVIEPDINDLTNLNRYGLLRRSRVGMSKVEDLVSWSFDQLSISGLHLRYDHDRLDTIGPLAASVLVGVDNVPSRWAVQQGRPDWLGIGATERFWAMRTFHSEGLPCASCLHPDGADDLEGEVPTAAFVSHWAGLSLAAALSRKLLGAPLGAEEQRIELSTLRLDSPYAFRQTRGYHRPDCHLGCSEVAMVAGTMA